LKKVRNQSFKENRPPYRAEKNGRRKAHTAHERLTEQKKMPSRPKGKTIKEERVHPGGQHPVRTENARANSRSKGKRKVIGGVGPPPRREKREFDRAGGDIVLAARKRRGNLLRQPCHKKGKSPPAPKAGDDLQRLKRVNPEKGKNS